MRYWLSLGVILFLGADASAQTAVTFTPPRVVCSAASIGTDPVTRPAANSVFEVYINGAIYRRDDRFPYRVDLPNGGPGQYRLKSQWVTNGVAKVLDEVFVTCHAATVTVTPVPPPPTPVHCDGTWSAPVETVSACVNGSQTVTSARTFSVTTQPANGGNACPASPGVTTTTRSCTVEPPPPTGQIWGLVDPDVLGDFTAAEHDAWTVDGGDGFRYRVWHPQCPVIQNGVLRCYAHEHGDDPATAGDAWVRSQWDGRFGYAARRYKHHPGEPDGHLEAHEGYKVFVANKGDTNDEGRVNRTWTLASFHMGSYRPGRFNTQHHSGSLASRHDWTGEPEMRLKFHLLLDTGGIGIVCDDRATQPVKDVIQINAPCKVQSPYEIWSATQTIREAGASQEIARVFQTPAVFDSVSVFNPLNPTELVLAWDPRVADSKVFPNDWSHHKGMVRETYAQNPYFYTGNRTTDIYWTDPMGLVVPSTDPNAIQQYVQHGLNRVGETGVKSTADNVQFKMKVDYGRGCEPNRDGVCTRLRPGLTGKINPSKLGIKN